MNKQQETISELLRHIEIRYGWYFERPKMYTHDAYGLQILLLTLEDLREFVLRGTKAGAPMPQNGYSRYLFETHRDLNGHSIVSRECERLATDPRDDRVYKALIDTWRDYSNSSYRLPLDAELDEVDE
jgi:hypothetical protein